MTDQPPSITHTKPRRRLPLLRLRRRPRLPEPLQYVPLQPKTTLPEPPRPAAPGPDDPLEEHVRYVYSLADSFTPESDGTFVISTAEYDEYQLAVDAATKIKRRMSQEALRGPVR